MSEQKENYKDAKKPIVYVDYLLKDMREVYTGYKPHILQDLKEKIMVYYESQRYDKIVEEVCPAIAPYELWCRHR